MPIQSNPTYTIKESSYFKGGFKIKRNGETISQQPTLEQAITYCQKLVDYEGIVIYTDAQGNKSEIPMEESW